MRNIEIQAGKSCAREILMCTGGYDKTQWVNLTRQLFD